MCGICGTLNFSYRNVPSREILHNMISAIRHRGPDDLGTYSDEQVSLGHARLSILDLENGAQPLANEDQSVWVVFNGEIFNFPELREGLLKKGHRFRTRTDTEVLVHLYEDQGTAFLGDLNGQFAFAIWDVKQKQLFLARDRFGIAPLFYTRVGDTWLFASEVKALFTHPGVKTELDPFGLEQLFTFWSTLPPRTVFKGIQELPPAHYLTLKNNTARVQAYWDLDFPDPAAGGRVSPRQEADFRDALMELLLDSVRIRLRADVTVASFLSGGLDSSFISAMIRKHFNPSLQTFSVRFADENFDEGRFQQEMAGFLGTAHHETTCQVRDIGAAMPAVVWHAEKPLVRTAPAPLYLLAGLVRQNNIKVVLTGEGADEILGGYDLFREMKIRRFWARRPESRLRPLLLQRLYPYLKNWGRAPRVLEAYYRAGIGRVDYFAYSHLPRWEMTAWTKRLFSEELRGQLRGYDAAEELAAGLPQRFSAWDPLAQAQYLEIKTLLSGNLLSSQGDRMVMAHGVEARQPFLDHRLAEFCAALPPSLKLKGLQEKYLLKKAAEAYLPASITGRTKQAYRAPDGASFFGEQAPSYVEPLLSGENISRTGYFNPESVSQLADKCRRSAGTLGARENLAMVGIVTTLLTDTHFCRGGPPPEFRPKPATGFA